MVTCAVHVVLLLLFICYAQLSYGNTYYGQLLSAHRSKRQSSYLDAVRIPANLTITPAKKYLLQQSKYNRNIRPVRNTSTATPIETGIFINHMENLDEWEQTMTIHGVLSFAWEDEFLQFRYQQQHGHQELHFRPSEIWLPNIIVVNRAESDYTFKGWNAPLTVTPLGNVFYFQAASLKVTCQFDFTDFPFDKQSCPAVLASREGRLGEAPLIWPRWGAKAINFMSDSFHNIPEVNPTNKSHPGYTAGQWKMLSAYNITKYGYYDQVDRKRKIVDVMPNLNGSDADNVVIYLELWFDFQRSVPYYGCIVLLPCIITSTLTLLSYWVPSENSAAALLIINLMVQSLFLLDLTQKVPPTQGDSIPRIVKFYALNLCNSFLSLLIQLALYAALSAKGGWLYDRITSTVTSLRELKVFQHPAVMLDINFDEGIIVENVALINAERPEVLLQNTLNTCRKCLFVAFFIIYFVGIAACLLV